jgi:hypothetical protein
MSDTSMFEEQRAAAAEFIRKVAGTHPTLRAAYDDAKKRARKRPILRERVYYAGWLLGFEEKS